MSVKELRRMESALMGFLEHDPKASGSRVAMFLYIARNEGCSLKDIANSLHISYVNAQKNLEVIGSHTSRGVGLVETEEVSDPYPRKALSLTVKGRKVAKGMGERLSGKP